MNKEELRGKSKNELMNIKTSLEKEIVDAYFDMRTGKEENVRKPRLLRKQLAVVKTCINSKKSDKLKNSAKNG